MVFIVWTLEALEWVLKLGQRFGKTAISKFLKGISVGKFKSPEGH